MSQTRIIQQASAKAATQTQSYRQLILRGIWSENPTTVHLLGLCPLLAVTTSLRNGIFLGIASLITVTLSSLSASLLRRHLSSTIRLPVYIVLIATIVSCIDLLSAAYHYELYTTIGLFIPLIVTNCFIAARAESFASRNPPLPALLDGIGCGLGMLLALTLVGTVRELSYSGSLSLFGNEPTSLFIVAVLPAGAFFTLAALVVVQRAMAQRTLARRSQR